MAVDVNGGLALFWMVSLSAGNLVGIHEAGLILAYGTGGTPSVHA